MNELLELPVPPSVVTEIRPVLAPAGTVITRLPVDVTAKGAFTPPTLAEDTPARFVPVTATIVPTVPEAGEKVWIRGAINLLPTEKLELLTAIPAMLLTPIFPVVAPLGTPVTMVVLESSVKGALTPLKLT